MRSRGRHESKNLGLFLIFKSKASDPPGLVDACWSIYGFANVFRLGFIGRLGNWMLLNRTSLGPASRVANGASQIERRPNPCSLETQTFFALAALAAVEFLLTEENQVEFFKETDVALASSLDSFEYGGQGTMNGLLQSNNSDTSNSNMEQDKGFAVFTYGSLRHNAVYARAIAGANWASVPEPLRTPATLHGFKRHPVLGAAYPAIIATENAVDQVDGSLSYVPNEDYLRALDEFEGDDYARLPVRVETEDGTMVEATAWVWIAGAHWLDLNAEWHYEDFLKNRLEAWLAMSDEDFAVVGETKVQIEVAEDLVREVASVVATSGEGSVVELEDGDEEDLRAELVVKA